MASPKIADKVVETDVLVMGAGLGGCPAAAKAAEHGLNVTLVEKSKPERSGACAMGRDELQPFTREGVTALDIVKSQLRQRRSGSLRDPNVLYKIIDNSLWALEELERLGITMKWGDGTYHWTAFGSGTFGSGTEAKLSLSVPWLNVKPEMAAAVRKRGVNVVERTMIVDLLTNNGKVVGATAVNTRTGEFIVIKAKAVVIAAGKFVRHYNPTTPASWKYKMHYEYFPGSGDGYAVAYRAGVDLTCMELMRGGNSPDELLLRGCHFGEEGLVSPKIFASTGEEIPNPRQISSMGPLEYIESERKGLAPFYRSLEDVPEDFHKRIEVAVVHERLLQFKLSEDRGFNPRIHPYEIGYPHHHTAHDHATGIKVDEDLKGSFKGVYAIGDCDSSIGNGCVGAITSGFLVGDNVDRYVSEAGEAEVDEAQVQSQKQAVLAPLKVKDGVEPMELECTIRYICEEYASILKSQGRLREGLRRLGSLKRVFLPKLMAINPHYLMRCLEVRNIMDLAEVYLRACLERKETRGDYIRLDYPETNPSLGNKRICQRIENGKAVLEIKEVPALKPEYAKEKK